MATMKQKYRLYLNTLDSKGKLDIVGSGAMLQREFYTDELTRNQADSIVMDFIREKDTNTMPKTEVDYDMDTDGDDFEDMDDFWSEDWEDEEEILEELEDEEDEEDEEEILEDEEEILEDEEEIVWSDEEDEEDEEDDFWEEDEEELEDEELYFSDMLIREIKSEYDDSDDPVGFLKSLLEEERANKHRVRLVSWAEETLSLLESSENEIEDATDDFEDVEDLDHLEDTENAIQSDTDVDKLTLLRTIQSQLQTVSKELNEIQSMIEKL